MRETALRRRNLRRRRPAPAIRWTHILGFLLIVVPGLGWVAHQERQLAPCIPDSVNSCR